MSKEQTDYEDDMATRANVQDAAFDLYFALRLIKKAFDSDGGRCPSGPLEVEAFEVMNKALERAEGK